MNSLYTICYISNAAPQLSDTDIETIFSETSKNNNACGIGGFLLYNLGHFFQVLEGDKKHIIDLYENKIKNDDRHQVIYEVYKKDSVQPIFDNYKSKFNIVKTEEDFQKIKECLRNVRTTTSNKLARLLEPFVLFQQIG
jgi:hypothetical protein